MIVGSDGRFETAMNHVVELGASWLLLAPFRTLAMIGGAVQGCFQLAIIVSGNLSFLNYLTMLPFIWCFDDRRDTNAISYTVFPCFRQVFFLSRTRVFLVRRCLFRYSIYYAEFGSPHIQHPFTCPIS